MAKYETVVPGIFQQRPNRFLARVEIHGRMELCHVKNTGRCRELLIPGVRVWCQRHEGGKRKTAFSVIAVEKGRRLINFDSQIPNQAAWEWLAAGGLGAVPEVLRREVVFGQSRLDFYLEIAGRRIFLEVKGVTLEEDGWAYFPDAPTQRGSRHLQELSRAVEEGYEAYVLFVVQMDDVRGFSPNWRTDPDFARQLCLAEKAGVNVLVRACRVTPPEMVIAGAVPALLDPETAPRLREQDGDGVGDGGEAADG